jgi:FkbM family methyltransferase
MNRYLRWQIASRLLPGAVQVPFVNGSVLVVSPGMQGATQNIYTGLSDFFDCGFLLHLLRKEDLFVDIGANVGVYTVLAGAAIGSKAVAIEPIPATFSGLCANIRANGMSERVTAHNIGLGQTEQTLRFTTDRDCMNRVIAEDDWTGKSIDVPVRRLDTVLAGESPTLIKIDVEGYESEVLAGAEATRKTVAAGADCRNGGVYGQLQRKRGGGP